MSAIVAMASGPGRLPAQTLPESSARPAAAAPRAPGTPALKSFDSAGDTLTLALGDVLELALTQNPELLAQRRLADAARGRLRQAGVLPFNPEFVIESEQVGNGRTLQAYEGEFSQEIEWAGQRGLRKQAARLDLARANATVRNAERLTTQAAAAAFYRAAAAQRRVRVAEEILDLNRNLLAAVSEMLVSGAVSELEANLARVESGRAQSRVLTERRDAASAFLELKRILALPETLTVRVTDSFPQAPDPAEFSLDTLAAQALARRPDMESAARGVEVSRSLLSLTRREALPNLRLSVPFDRLEGPGSEQVGIGVGISIPLWNRNQGTADELRAEVERTRYELEAVERAIRSEVSDALQRYASASAEERMASRVILGPARQSQEMLQAAYRAGKIDLPGLLLIRNELLDAELDYWESWLERRLELVRLQAVIAAPLPNE
ncbi:MAG: TolC family protein [Gemmatimonadota bacterium]